MKALTLHKCMYCGYITQSHKIMEVHYFCKHHKYAHNKEPEELHDKAYFGKLIICHWN